MVCLLYGLFIFLFTTLFMLLLACFTAHMTPSSPPPGAALLLIPCRPSSSSVALLAACLLLFFCIRKPSLAPYGTGFYKGRIADALVAAVQERGGVMTLEDLSAHRCEHRDPIMSTYRGYHIYEVAPPTAVSPGLSRP